MAPIKVTVKVVSFYDFNQPIGQCPNISSIQTHKPSQIHFSLPDPLSALFSQLNKYYLSVPMSSSALHLLKKSFRVSPSYSSILDWLSHYLSLLFPNTLLTETLKRNRKETLIYKMSSGHRRSGSYGSSGSQGSGRRPRRPSNPGSHQARELQRNRPHPNIPYPYPITAGNPANYYPQAPPAQNVVRGGFGNAPQDRGRPITYDSTAAAQTVRPRSGSRPNPWGPGFTPPPNSQSNSQNYGSMSSEGYAGAVSVPGGNEAGRVRPGAFERLGVYTGESPGSGSQSRGSGNVFRLSRSPSRTRNPSRQGRSQTRSDSRSRNSESRRRSKSRTRY